VEAVPVIARGHNVALFVPPVAGAALAQFRHIPNHPVLVLTSGADRVPELAEEPWPAGSESQPARLAVTGLSRAARRLAGELPGLVLVGAVDALALLKRSALRMAEFRCVVIAWPEQFDEDGLAALEAVMAEADRESQRLIMTSSPGRDIEALVDRYAFKALTFGFATGEPGSKPTIGPARYVLAPGPRLSEIRRRVLDALDPASDDAIAVAGCPVNREEAEKLAAEAGPEPPVFVVEPHQLAWLRSLFSPLSALPLPAALDKLEQRAEAIRARLARVIEHEDLGRELLLLGPLLRRFEPAEVAAAALRMAAHPAQRVVATLAGPGGGVEGTDASSEAGGGWARLWVGVGRKDGVRPGDLLGAIVGEAKVPASTVGRIELRELFTLVEVKSEHAERVVTALAGVTLRGRRVVARVDRGSGGAHRPPRRL
jgi:ATP-dependent RNA helicase DeaD